MTKTLLRIGYIFFVLCILISCGTQPGLTPLSEDAVILAFGDSITHGTGAAPGLSYPEVLEQLIKRRVIRSGIPGETTIEGLERLPAVLRETEPDLVILCHGGNDILRKMDTRQTSENLMTMIRIIRDNGSNVVLIGVPKPGLLLSTAPLYGEVAKKMDVPFADTILAEILSKGNLKSDYIHPNARGYARLAEAIAELLYRHRALERR